MPFDYVVAIEDYWTANYPVKAGMPPLTQLANTLADSTKTQMQNWLETDDARKTEIAHDGDQARGAAVQSSCDFVREFQWQYPNYLIVQGSSRKHGIDFVPVRVFDEDQNAYQDEIAEIRQDELLEKLKLSIVDREFTRGGNRRPLNGFINPRYSWTPDDIGRGIKAHARDFAPSRVKAQAKGEAVEDEDDAPYSITEQEDPESQFASPNDSGAETDPESVDQAAAETGVEATAKAGAEATSEAMRQRIEEYVRYLQNTHCPDDAIIEGAVTLGFGELVDEPWFVRLLMQKPNATDAEVKAYSKKKSLADIAERSRDYRQRELNQNELRSRIDVELRRLKQQRQSIAEQTKRLSAPADDLLAGDAAAARACKSHPKDAESLRGELRDLNREDDLGEAQRSVLRDGQEGVEALADQLRKRLNQLKLAARPKGESVIVALEKEIGKRRQEVAAITAELQEVDIAKAARKARRDGIAKALTGVEQRIATSLSHRHAEDVRRIQYAIWRVTELNAEGSEIDDSTDECEKDRKEIERVWAKPKRGELLKAQLSAREAAQILGLPGPRAAKLRKVRVEREMLPLVARVKVGSSSLPLKPPAFAANVIKHATRKSNKLVKDVRGQGGGLKPGEVWTTSWKRRATFWQRIVAREIQRCNGDVAMRNWLMDVDYYLLCVVYGRGIAALLGRPWSTWQQVLRI